MGSADGEDVLELDVRARTTGVRERGGLCRSMSSSVSSGANRRDCEELLACAFQNSGEIGDWLLATSDSRRVTLAPTDLMQSMAVTYSAVMRPECSDWRSSLSRLYDSLVVPQYISSEVVLGSLYTDNQTSDVFFPQSDVREASPITRVAVKLSAGLEILHWIPLTNGQSIFSVSQFVEDVGFVVTRILLDTDGQTVPPSRQHIVRWIRTVDTSNCLVCNTKGLLQCGCDDVLSAAEGGGTQHEPQGIVQQLQTCNSWTRWVDNAVQARNKLARTDITMYSGTGSLLHRAALQTCMTVERSSPSTHFTAHQRFVSLLLSPNARSDLVLAPRRESNPLLGPPNVTGDSSVHAACVDRVLSFEMHESHHPLLLQGASHESTDSQHTHYGAVFDQLCASHPHHHHPAEPLEKQQSSTTASPSEQLPKQPSPKLSGRVRKPGDSSKNHSRFRGGVASASSTPEQQHQQNWECEVCGALFARKYDMKRHAMSKHVGARLHKCGACGMEFKHSWHLDSHRKVVHEKIQRFSCELCGKKFGSLSNKNEHVAVHHPVDDSDS